MVLDPDIVSLVRAVVITSDVGQGLITAKIILILETVVCKLRYIYLASS